VVKVVLVGAGSASFGRGAVADLLASEELEQLGLEVVLVDVDEEALGRMFKFAELVRKHYGRSARIRATADRREALPGAKYVITAVARDRYKLWEQEFLIPFAYGFRQVYGENGGPGAAFHTLRSLHLMVPIARDMEELCPDALLINYSNPESRVCLGVSKLTRVKVVGLCHGAFDTLREVARILGRSKEEIEITIGGINHFHWVLEIWDRNTGEDLYPLFRRRMAESDWGLDGLTWKLYHTFGLFPFPAESHTGEYVGFGYDVTGPYWLSWSHEAARWKDEEVERIRRVAKGEEPLTEDMAKPTEELAVPIICDIELDRGKRELSVNVPNEGPAVENLPEDAIVEVPAVVDRQGVHPVKVGALPEAIAAMCRLQISIQKLLVDAYRERSKELLLQALALDPTVDSIDRARAFMEEMLAREKEYLPEFR